MANIFHYNFFKHSFLALQASHSKWQMVFYVTAGIATAGALIFIVLFSGEELTWATEARRKQLEEDEQETDPSNNVSVNS